MTPGGHATVAQPVPTVSVVIPTYNYGRFLSECLDSVRQQAGVELDIVVVDDGSSDETADVCARVAERDPRLRTVRHEVNRGHIATFNHALELAEGEYVVKLDADDCLTPGSLARSSALLTRHPQVAFVYGRPQVFTGAAPRVEEEQAATRRRTGWTVWSGETWVEDRLRRGHNPIKQPEVMMRRSGLRAVGGHRSEVPASSDLNLWLRLASVGDVGRINGPVQGLYRMHDTNMHDTMHGGVMSDLRARWDAFELFVDEGDLARREARLQTLRRTFARDATRVAETLCDADEVDLSDVEAVLAFAASLSPGPHERWRQRVVRQRVSLIRRGHLRAARRVPARIKRDLEGRLRWQQWDRQGL